MWWSGYWSEELGLVYVHRVVLESNLLILLNNGIYQDSPSPYWLEHDGPMILVLLKPG